MLVFSRIVGALELLTCDFIIKSNTVHKTVLILYSSGHCLESNKYPMKVNLCLHTKLCKDSDV